MHLYMSVKSKNASSTNYVIENAGPYNMLFQNLLKRFPIIFCLTAAIDFSFCAAGVSIAKHSPNNFIISSW